MQETASKHPGKALRLACDTPSPGFSAPAHRDGHTHWRRPCLWELTAVIVHEVRRRRYRGAHISRICVPTICAKFAVACRTHQRRRVVPDIPESERSATLVTVMDDALKTLLPQVPESGVLIVHRTGSSLENRVTAVRSRSATWCDLPNRAADALIQQRMRTVCPTSSRHYDTQKNLLTSAATLPVPNGSISRPHDLSLSPTRTGATRDHRMTSPCPGICISISLDCTLLSPKKQ